MHCKSYSHFFSKKFQHICISLNVNFNESLTNNVVSYEQLDPDWSWYIYVYTMYTKKIQKKKSELQMKYRFFFLFLYESIMLGYLLEVPPRGSSNEYTQHFFLEENRKQYLSTFLIWSYNQPMIHQNCFVF